MKVSKKVRMGIPLLLFLLFPISAYSAQDVSEKLGFMEGVKEVDWYKVIDSRNIVLGWKVIPDTFYGWNHKAAISASKLSFHEVKVWSVRFSNKSWRPGEGGQICYTLAKKGRVKKTNCRR